jgi:phosphoesterase RecJ-like protein
MIWSELTALVAAGNSFLIATHVNPDGDCIGSELAFAWYCRSLHKEVVIYNRDPVPHKLSFLAGTDLIVTQQPERCFDVLVVLDASNQSRLGWEGSGDKAPVILNIDHHEDNTRFGNYNFVDTTMAATGEIIFSFFSSCAIDYPPTVAEALYTAMLTDTGGFRFENTSPALLRACGTLVERGADNSRIYNKIYASRSPAAMLLLSRIWSTLAFYENNTICTMELPLCLIEELGANYGDSEGIADMTISANGVKVGMMIKFTDFETHFSLRSNNQVDVGRVARSIPGGGGHCNAAGCTIPLPVAEAKARMLAIVAREIG